MKRRILGIGSLAILSLLVPVYGKTAGLRSQSSVTSSDQAAAQRAVVNQYCSTCHSDKAKAAGMDSARKIDFDRLDIADVSRDAETWERVVRKLRAGMMPPTGIRRPDRETYKGLIAWLENELDRNAVTYMPPPGLHRLNRREYANVIQALLDLDIDPAKYLPSDDSTHGFDNIAGALGVSSTLVEAYVSAGQKISRLAIGVAATPALTVYRTPEDTSQDYQIEGLPFGTRGGMLVKHVFPSDGEYSVTVTPIFGDNMSPTGFGSVPCEKLEILLDSERLDLMDWQGSRRFGAPQANCGGTPAFTFFPHVGTIRIEGPYNATPATQSASRARVFVCRPATAADEGACAKKIVTSVATRAFRHPATNAEVQSLMAFYQDGRTQGDFNRGIETTLARILADPKF